MTLSYSEWIQIGLENRWCGPAVCFTHDGLPTTLDEDNDDEFDNCVHIIRLYENVEIAKAVEENHSPSVWRKP